MNWGLLFILLGLFSILGIGIFIKNISKARYLQSPAYKFSRIVEILNEAAFDGNGEVIGKGNQRFDLYQEYKNQIIQFYSIPGLLTITWKFKWHHNEVVHEKVIEVEDSLTILAQDQMGNDLVSEMKQVKDDHIHRINKKLGVYDMQMEAVFKAMASTLDDLVTLLNEKNTGMGENPESHSNNINIAGDDHSRFEELNKIIEAWKQIETIGIKNDVEFDNSMKNLAIVINTYLDKTVKESNQEAAAIVNDVEEFNNSLKKLTFLIDNYLGIRSRIG